MKLFKLISFRTIEYLLLAPFCILLLLVLAVFVTYWLEDRPQFGIPAHLAEDQVILVDHFPRTFAAYVPGGVAADTPLPLVIVLHPHVAGVRDVVGKGFVPLPEAVWMDVAEREKFLLFYPQGLIARDGKYGWNDCRIASAANPVSNDVAFLKALIAYAGQTYNLDADRVYVAGMSNGGFMALRMAQEGAGHIAAAAAAAALMPRKSECEAPPQSPVSVLFMYGDEDWIVPPGGGDMPEGRGVLHSADETLHLWAKWNGLDGVAAQQVDVPDAAPGDHVRAQLSTIAAPDGTVAVAAYRLAGQGHAAPSIAMPQPWWMSALFGWQSHDIEMAEAMWDFFKNRARQAP